MFKRLVQLPGAWLDVFSPAKQITRRYGSLPVHPPSVSTNTQKYVGDAHEEQTNTANNTTGHTQTSAHLEVEALASMGASQSLPFCVAM